MAADDTRKLRAYATAFAGCLLLFLTLGSAVVFFDVATVLYLDLPMWVMAATLAATVTPIAWFAVRLFGQACAYELDPRQASAELPDGGIPN